jgi:hypothetical protein
MSDQMKPRVMKHLGGAYPKAMFTSIEGLLDSGAVGRGSG